MSATEGSTLPVSRDAAVQLAAKAHDRLDRLEERSRKGAVALVVVALVLAVAFGWTLGQLMPHVFR